MEVPPVAFAVEWQSYTSSWSELRVRNVVSVSSDALSDVTEGGDERESPRRDLRIFCDGRGRRRRCANADGGWSPRLAVWWSSRSLLWQQECVVIASSMSSAAVPSSPHQASSHEKAHQWHGKLGLTTDLTVQ